MWWVWGSLVPEPGPHPRWCWKPGLCPAQPCSGAWEGWLGRLCSPCHRPAWSQAEPTEPMIGLRGLGPALLDLSGEALSHVSPGPLQPAPEQQGTEGGTASSSRLELLFPRAEHPLGPLSPEGAPLHAAAPFQALSIWAGIWGGPRTGDASADRVGSGDGAPPWLRGPALPAWPSAPPPSCCLLLTDAGFGA